MHDETKKTAFLDRAAEFVIEHPFVTGALIILFEILAMAALVQFSSH